MSKLQAETQVEAKKGTPRLGGGGVQSGREFERMVARYFGSTGLELEKDYPVFVGRGIRQKVHRFDLGCKFPPVLVSCKFHGWTSGGYSPSAKLTLWNEAMYYFDIAPREFRKLFCVGKAIRPGSDLTLARHYLNKNWHLVPDDVEFWEFDVTTGQGARIR